MKGTFGSFHFWGPFAKGKTRAHGALAPKNPGEQGQGAAAIRAFPS